MFYKFLNRKISDKIGKLYPIAIKYLSEDFDKNDDEAISERLKVVRNYALLHKYYEADQKCLYMINRNYFNFLVAITFLYRTSRTSVAAGVLTAPAEVYHTISAVQKSFKELTKSLSLKDN